MKDIRAVRGRYYIQSLVEEGEHVNQDFKFAVSDARKIARSVSAFANHDGGRLLIGVKDNGVIAGVRVPDEEIYVVEHAARRYCSPSQEVRFTLFKVNPGVVVVRAEVEAADGRPVLVDEGGGRMQAYFRVADENIAAHPLMVEAWRRRASDTGRTLSFDSGSLCSEILRVLAEGPLPAERLALAVHASAAAVTDSVVTLASMRLVAFAFDGQMFVPALPGCANSFTI